LGKGELDAREVDGMVRFAVRVTPRASRAAITGVHGGALKVSLTAPPVEGAANAALIELLSSALGVPKRAVRIEHGDHNRQKTLAVEGVTLAAVRALIKAR
jgi:uncharacterized protein (TIGR00251 family)